ncbi:MAG: hypothetical protein HRU02_15720 [Myxococcales bacterium]|nr:hypothetical protein [Myxococcales bacterium]
MGRVIRILGLLLLVGLALFAVVAMAARFHDGPLAILPGGPLTSGTLTSAQGVDWSFATDIPEVEFQLLEPPRSRTLWVLVDEGRIFVPCGFLDLPLWKQWPREALSDGRALLRVAGRRYPVQAVRVHEPSLYAKLGELAAAKYGLGGGAASSPDTTWFFELLPRG